MALFNPPLHKRGNKKCPSCGNPVWWASMWSLWFGSSTYMCSRCGDELKVDMRRSVLGWVVCVAYYTLWFWILMGLRWGGAFLFLTFGAILFCVLDQWWFTSVRLSNKAFLERTEWRNPPLHKLGNKRCPSCGSPVRPESRGGVWSTRYCTWCGSPVRLDGGRFIVGLALTVVLYMPMFALYYRAFYDEDLLPWCLGLQGLWYWIPLIFNAWWSVSIKPGKKAPVKPSES